MQLNALTIREAILKDLECLQLLEQAVVTAERPFNTAIKPRNATYYDLNKLLQEHNCRLVVAEIADEIIATGYVQIRNSKISLNHEQHGYLGFMYVAPAYRGLGINKLIMDDLIHWSKSKGIKDFYLDVYEGNHAAINAYKKLGFSKSLVEMKMTITE
ncbi:GNAT family N-acetyltransferase [Colwelliaceae bacterium MEBiC 14330]